MKPGKPEKTDVALIHGRTSDGEGLRIVRRREDEIQLGEVRPLKEGKPIHGEVVSLKPRPDFPLLCDVSTHVEGPAAKSELPASGRTGPAQVATDDYRKNWDAIFSRRALAN